MIRVVKKKSYSKRRAEDYILKRKLKFALSKFTRFFQIFLIAFIIALAVWVFKFDGGNKIANYAYTKTENFFLSFDLKIKSIEISGNKTVTTDIILEKIFKSLGDVSKKSIILLDLVKLKEDITSIGWIESVDIKKKLPDKLVIKVTERSPKIIWQNNGRLWLADQFGHLLIEGVEKKYINLPIVIGHNNEKDIPELYDILSASKNLSALMKSATKVGNRRWDINLNNGIKIKLPEESAQRAWVKLEELVKKNSLFSKNINYIDMRIEGQLVTGLAEEKEAGTENKSEETTEDKSKESLDEIFESTQKTEN